MKYDLPTTLGKSRLNVCKSTLAGIDVLFGEKNTSDQIKMATLADKSDIYSLAEKRISKIRDPYVRTSCGNALLVSLKSDDGKVYSAADLSRRFGLAKEILLDNVIVISKNEIVAYLRNFGLFHSLPVVSKQISKLSLKEKFGEEYDPQSVRRKLCMSYQEVRKFYNID